MPGYPWLMHATKRRVSNATTKIVKKAKIQLLYYVATQNTVKSFYKLATFSFATLGNKKSIMIGKRKLSNWYTNLAGDIPPHIVIANGLCK